MNTAALPKNAYRELFELDARFGGMPSIISIMQDIRQVPDKGSLQVRAQYILAFRFQGDYVGQITHTVPAEHGQALKAFTEWACAEHGYVETDLGKEFGAKTYQRL